MRENSELPVENATRTETSDGGGHAGAQVDIKSGLGAVIGFEIDNRTLGGAGKLQFLGLGAVLVPAFDDLFRLCFLFQTNRNGFGVAVFHRDAVALRAHGECAGDHFGAVELAQKFLRFLLHLFLFVFDERDDVAEDVERGYTGISRTADGLHRDGHHGFEAKPLMDRRESEDQSDGGAVGIGNDVAAVLFVPCLNVDQLNVASVDFRDHQRDVFIHAQRAGVGNDRATRVGKARLEFGGDRGIERGEDHLGRAIGCGRRNLHFGDGGWDRCLEAPARGVRIGLAFGAVGSGQPCHLEPRVVLEHLDKSLSYDAGGAQDSYRNLFHGYMDFITSGELNLGGSRVWEIT